VPDALVVGVQTKSTFCRLHARIRKISEVLNKSLRDDSLVLIAHGNA
jgi:hypothetical protein